MGKLVSEKRYNNSTFECVGKLSNESIYIYLSMEGYYAILVDINDNVLATFSIDNMTHIPSLEITIED
jgi:hypothetical protein